MLPRGPKRGGIRETVGFEERKAERGKGKDGRRIGGWCVAWGAVGRADVNIGPPHRIPCNVSLVWQSVTPSPRPPLGKGGRQVIGGAPGDL